MSGPSAQESEGVTMRCALKVIEENGLIQGGFPQECEGEKCGIEECPVLKLWADNAALREENERVRARLHRIEQIDDESDKPTEREKAFEGTPDWYKYRCDVLAAIKLKLCAEIERLKGELEAKLAEELEEPSDEERFAELVENISSLTIEGKARLAEATGWHYQMEPAAEPEQTKAIEEAQVTVPPSDTIRPRYRFVVRAKSN